MKQVIMPCAKKEVWPCETNNGVAIEVVSRSQTLFLNARRTKKESGAQTVCEWCRSEYRSFSKNRWVLISVDDRGDDLLKGLLLLLLLLL